MRKHGLHRQLKKEPGVTAGKGPSSRPCAVLAMIAASPRPPNSAARSGQEIRRIGENCRKAGRDGA